MILLIRFILVSIIIYLIVKSFVRYFAGEDNDEHRGGSYAGNREKNKGVSKEIGEYVDYEEIDKKKK